MRLGDRKLLVCNCEKTMALDGGKLGKALGGEVLTVHEHLCRGGIAAYEEALAGGEKLLVACTQEAPLFSEIAADAGGDKDVHYVNIRENAGWCDAKTAPHAKIAALLAAAMHTPKAARLRTIQSDGLCLVYGKGQQAFETAMLLAARLSVTLLLSDTDDLVLPSVLDMPIVRGRMARATGHFGAFEVTIDGYAPLVPSSRAEPEFLMPRDDAKSECSLILDISGGTPLFTGHERRDGYAHVDPGNPAAVLKAAYEMSDMVGEFEKPIYVTYDEDICAHARSHKVGCTKCLDNCPAGAITEAGDGVAIDAVVCGGCGLCAAVCPTGAVAAAYPPQADTIARIQTLVGTYLGAGGAQPVLLVHDGTYGTELIGVIARLGPGLPGHVLPVQQHSATGFGHVEMLAAFAAGAERIVFLTDPRHEDELPGMHVEAKVAEAILGGLGFTGEGRISILAEADPDVVEAALYALDPHAIQPAGDLKPVGNKREVARTIISRLAEAGGAGEALFDLPAGAPYGHLLIDTKACTLCMSCVSACPASALFDNPDMPQLRFVESACVQCGICATTCPENAITLDARLNLSPAALRPEILNEEEPFACIECGKPFATKSTIDHISGKLAGKHSMYLDEERIRLIQMCDDCRVVSQANSRNDPFASGARPKVRTTDDYISARERGSDIDDFLIED